MAYLYPSSCSILWWWKRRYSFVASYLIPRYRDCLKLHGWWPTRCVPPYAANIVITANIIFLLFVISQKQMRRWAIIFREAHSTLLARPRFQSKAERKLKGDATERETHCYALMGDDGSERIGPSPYDEEHADHRGGEKEDEGKRSYGLRFWGGACLWTF
jgi:hypothetical protein